MPSHWNQRNELRLRHWMTFRACLLNIHPFLPSAVKAGRTHFWAAQTVRSCPVLEVGGWKWGHGISLLLQAPSGCKQAGCCPSRAPVIVLTAPSKDTHRAVIVELGRNMQILKQTGFHITTHPQRFGTAASRGLRQEYPSITGKHSHYGNGNDNASR